MENAKKKGNLIKNYNKKREILKKIPAGKIEIFSTDAKDKEIAEQLTNFVNFAIDEEMESFCNQIAYGDDSKENMQSALIKPFMNIELKE